MGLMSRMKMPRFQTFWVQLRKNKPLNEIRKSDQTSRTGKCNKTTTRFCYFMIFTLINNPLESFYEVVFLLARVIGLLGPIDYDMLERGHETSKYFTVEFDLYRINEAFVIRDLSFSWSCSRNWKDIQFALLSRKPLPSEGAKAGSGFTVVLVNAQPPSRRQRSQLSAADSKRLLYGRFILSPLMKGQADTIGIAMRRALLGEIEGKCITRAKSEKISHEYATIMGIQESVHEILMNLKEIVLRSNLYGTCEASICVRGPRYVTAQDIILPPYVEIVDNTHHIASLTEPGRRQPPYMVLRLCGDLCFW
ncbi:putative DNA-directed RNA polymerase [Helianthus anomalus]